MQRPTTTLTEVDVEQAALDWQAALGRRLVMLSSGYPRKMDGQVSAISHSPPRR